MALMRCTPVPISPSLYEVSEGAGMAFSGVRHPPRAGSRANRSTPGVARGPPVQTAFLRTATRWNRPAARHPTVAKQMDRVGPAGRMERHDGEARPSVRRGAPSTGRRPPDPLRGADPVLLPLRRDRPHLPGGVAPDARPRLRPHRLRDHHRAGRLHGRPRAGKLRLRPSSGKIRDLIRAYGLLEIGIGVYCALLPLLLKGAAGCTSAPRRARPLLRHVQPRAVPAGGGPADRPHEPHGRHAAHPEPGPGHAGDGARAEGGRPLRRQHARRRARGGSRATSCSRGSAISEPWRSPPPPTSRWGLRHRVEPAGPWTSLSGVPAAAAPAPAKGGRQPVRIWRAAGASSPSACRERCPSCTRWRGPARWLSSSAARPMPSRRCSWPS